MSASFMDIATDYHFSVIATCILTCSHTHRHRNPSPQHAAIGSVKDMNPALNVIAHEKRVGPESEGIYDDAFVEALD